MHSERQGSFEEAASRFAADTQRECHMKASARNTLGLSAMTTTTNPSGVPSLAVVTALVVAIVAVVGVFVFDRNHELFRSRESTPASQAASASPADPPSADPPSSQMDKDGIFLWRLSTQGLQLTRSNGAAINDARRVCTRFASGESEQEIIQDMVRGSPGMSIDTASGFADTAISVYCPQGLLDTP